MAARSASTDRDGRTRRNGRRDEDLGRSKTTVRFARCPSKSYIGSREPGRRRSRRDVVVVTSSSSSKYSPSNGRTSRVTESSISVRADWVSRYSEKSRTDRSQDRVQYFGLPRNGKGDLKDWMEMEKREERLWRRSSKDEHKDFKSREDRAGQKRRGLKVEEPHKTSRRQSTEERGSSGWRRPGGMRDEPWDQAKRATGEREKEEMLVGRRRNWGQCSPMKRRGLSTRRVDSGSKSPVSRRSKAKVEEKRMLKAKKYEENQSVTAKGGPKRREGNKPVLGSSDSTKNEDQQDGALGKDNDEEFEEMLKRNQEYFEAAALPMEFEQDFDETRSQEEVNGSLNEASLGVNFSEYEEVEDGESRDEEVSSSGLQETDMKSSKPKADLNETVLVHSSPEVEVMGDVETTSEEEEEVNGAAKQHETRESVEEKVKEVAIQRVANKIKMDRLKSEIMALQEEAVKTREEEKSLEVKEQKLQDEMAALNRKTRPLQKGLRC